MSQSFDAIVVGAGPVGSVAAAALARRGARVALLEASPATRSRFAGELLHPGAVDVLRRLDLLDVPAAHDHPRNRGFAVSLRPGDDAVRLTYPSGATGWTFPFEGLVAGLRAQVVDRAGVTWLPGARAVTLAGQRLTVVHDGRERTLDAPLVVGADGRFGAMRRRLGIDAPKRTLSHMAGLTLRGVTLPHEGYGHVLCTTAGPALLYRIGPDTVRVCLDVPSDWRRADDRLARIAAAYGPALPAPLRATFVETLRDGDVVWALNEHAPRRAYGRPGAVLVGDAVGHAHPMTACGMLLGFHDAASLAEGLPFAAWAHGRHRASTASSLLATALYEIFALHEPATDALRRAILDLWARHAVRDRTMAILGGLDTRTSSLLSAGAEMIGRAAWHAVREGLRARDAGRTADALLRLADLTRWLSVGALPHAPRVDAPPTTPLSRPLPATERAA